MQNYQISVIEKEVMEGILKLENTKGSCLAFLRKINNLNMADNRGGERVVSIDRVIRNVQLLTE